MRHAEISGGGIAGLTAAAALAQRGWSVRLHERGPELREIGAGIFVWENGLRAIEAVDALDQALDGSERIDHWELRDERARNLQPTWMQDGARLFLIRRTELHRALADACIASGVEVVTSSTVAGATPEGEIVLESGETRKADLVVGADGVFSRVRDSLQLAIGVRDLEDGCGRHLIERLPEDPENRTLEYWDGGRRIGICPCGPGHVYVYLCCPADDQAGRAKPLDRDAWKKSFPQFHSVIDRIPDEGRWAPFYDVVCHSWHRGCVALIGDAAHAMSPNLGQGANVAMTSAVSLAEMLEGSTDVEATLPEWERRERPIVEVTQKYSRLYGKIGTAWPHWAHDARSALVYMMGRSRRFQRRINVAAHHFPEIAERQKAGAL